MSLGLKTIRAVKRMKIGFFLIWIMATCIALAFALKPQALDLGFEGADKLLHLGVFLSLTLIPVITFDKIYNIILGIVFVMSIGICIELFQYYMPTRQAEVMDVVYDGFGVALGTVMGLALRGIYQSLLPLEYVEAYIKPKS